MFVCLFEEFYNFGCLSIGSFHGSPNKLLFLFFLLMVLCMNLIIHTKLVLLVLDCVKRFFKPFKFLSRILVLEMQNYPIILKNVIPSNSHLLYQQTFDIIYLYVYFLILTLTHLKNIHKPQTTVISYYTSTQSKKEKKNKINT